MEKIWRDGLMKRKMSLAETAADHIMDIIRENGLKAGDRLYNEYELAKMLNVGRSTIREAVKSLESRNILTVRRGAGTFISQTEKIETDLLGVSLFGRDEQTALELLEVRLILEPESAALAAMLADEEDIAAIQKQNKKVTAQIRHGMNHSEEDAKLHQMIAAATKNRIIAKLIPIIQHSVGLAIEVTNMELAESSIMYHNQIVEAIARRDVRGARSAMVAHMGENRLYVLKEIERKKRFK